MTITPAHAKNDGNGLKTVGGYPQLLGGRPEQIASLRKYLSAFSAADFDVFPTFFQPDVVLDVGGLMPALYGVDAVVAFYKIFFQVVHEQIDPVTILGTDDAMSMDAPFCFTAKDDVPWFPMGQLVKGDFVTGRFFAHYGLVDGLISSIRVANFGPIVFHDLSGAVIEKRSG